MIAKLYVEWGFSSETFDFHRVYVRLDNRTIKPIWFGWIRWMWASLRRQEQAWVHFGYGYDERKNFYAAWNNRRIPDNIPIKVL